MIYYSTNNNYSSDNLLVCIPGLGTNHSLFSEFILELNNLNLFIISPDLRGCGKSIDIDGEFSINEAVEDIKEILDSHKNYNVVLFGYSQGGKVAQLFAKKFPDQISGLFLCNTFAKTPVTFKAIIEADLF